MVVYKAKNTITGNFYIGKTSLTLETREKLRQKNERILGTKKRK